MRARRARLPRAARRLRRDRPRPLQPGIDRSGRRSVGAPAGRLLPPRQRQLAEDDRVPGRQGLHRLVRADPRQDPGAAARASSRRRRRARPTPMQRRIGDLYASFMDEAAVERAGIAPLAGELAAIDAISRPAPARARRWARLARLGVEHAASHATSTRTRATRRSYVPTSSQGGLGLPDRDYYLKSPTTPSSRTCARSTWPTSRSCSTLAGDSAGDAASAARAIARARDRARARPVDARSRSATRSRPTTRSSSPALRDARAGFDWEAGSPRPALRARRRDVDRPASRATSGASPRSCATTPLPVWKAYLRTQPAPRRTRRTCRRRSSTRASPSSARRCAARREPAALEARRRLVDDVDRRGVGKLYVDASTSRRSTKARMDELVDNLLAAYGESIDDARLDEPGDQARGAGEARDVHAEDRLPEAGATTARSRSRSGDLVGNVDARARVRVRRATSPSSASRSTATSGA